MKEKSKVFFVSLFFLFFLFGCAKVEKKLQVEEKERVDPIIQKVSTTLSSMSLEEKIAQMFIIQNRTSVYTDDLQNELTTYKPGGLILFQENITSYEETLSLIKNIKSTSFVPLFIGIDQEGGSVQRISSLTDHNVTKIPYMYDLGGKNDEKLTKEVARVLALELRTFGINMDFAPSIDIWSNPKNTVIGKRSFGSNSDIVTHMGSIFGETLEENGILSVYKHFPGHGDTALDSHLGLPVIYKSFDDLSSFEWVPFQFVIDKGASAIMVGHLALPNITGDNTPATLSSKIVTDVLKDKLHFDGLIVTDALNMGALTKYYSERDIYRKAILAGNDLLLMPLSLERAISYIKEDVQNGVISEERIHDSVQKILTFKYRKIEEKYHDYLPSSYLGSMEHQTIINHVYE